MISKDVILYEILPCFDLDTDYWVRNKLRLVHPFFAKMFPKPSKSRKIRTLLRTQKCGMLQINILFLIRLNVRINATILRLNRCYNLRGIAKMAIISDNCGYIPRGLFGEILYCSQVHLYNLRIDSLAYRFIIIRNVFNRLRITYIIDQLANMAFNIYYDDTLPDGIIKIDTILCTAQIWGICNLLMPINKNIDPEFYEHIDGLTLSWRFGGSNVLNKLISRHRYIYMDTRSPIFRANKRMAFRIECFYHINLSSIDIVYCNAYDAHLLTVNPFVRIVVIAGDVSPLLDIYSFAEFFRMNDDYLMIIFNKKIVQINHTKIKL